MTAAAVSVGKETTTASGWRIRGRSFPLDRPLLMGILNVTPDSFSDGGELQEAADVVRRGQAHVDAGADLLDIGGESTRPGAQEVPEGEEVRRVVPMIRLLARELPSVPISIDTRKAAVARAALDAGAAVVNDVSALADPAMAEAVARADAGVVLMHMRGVPATMRDLARYDDVAREVAAELKQALFRARAAGIQDAAVVLDPGLGLAKTTEHNLRLIAQLGTLLELGRPVLLGPSRKSFLGDILGGVAAPARDVATAAACALGYSAGARIFRVHDVGMARDALLVAHAIRAAGGAG